MKKHTEEHKRKIGLALIGRIKSPETCEKIRLAKLGKPRSIEFVEKIRRPRKVIVTYVSLHEYVRKRIPKPELCPKCNETKKLDLANMTGVYNREFQNWQYLCRKCHINFDWARKKIQHENTV